MKNLIKKNFKAPLQRSPPITRIEIQDGRFEVAGAGKWHSYWRDPYHLLLTIPWLGFFIVLALGYLTINFLFALAYWAGGDCIANARPGSFLDAFFFSVQTLASIGYGAMFPKTLYANAVVTIEAMIGLLGIALMTGLAFARFSRPTARVLFSQFAVISLQDGIETLMFRAANQRRNQILEAQLRVYLLRDEITVEGKSMRRIYDLKLVRSQTPNFMLTWLAMHRIDQSSPLFGMSAQELREKNVNLSIIISGIDETLAQPVHARYVYTPQDILLNAQFTDVFFHTPEGHRHIDYSLFHDVVPLKPGDEP